MRVTLAVAVLTAIALTACTKRDAEKATLLELNDHPARKLETWGGVPATPLEQRVLHPAPERIVDYLRKDNIFQGFSEVPRQAQVDAALLADLRAAVKELPEEVKRLVAPKLLAIATIAELGGSAYVERVADGGIREAAGWLVIDTSVLDRKANEWATWKESTPFVGDDEHRIEAVIETPENNSRKNALQYILLHELGHIAALGRDIHPTWWRPAKNADTAKYTFFNLSWRARDERYVSIFDDAFPARATVRYYAPMEKRLPIARASELYDAIGQTNFPTLYGLTDRQDDFAEGFVTYVHTVLQKRPFEVRIYKGDTLHKTYRSCWDEPRCADKKAFFAKLLGSG